MADVPKGLFNGGGGFGVLNLEPTKGLAEQVKAVAEKYGLDTQMKESWKPPSSDHFICGSGKLHAKPVMVAKLDWPDEEYVVLASSNGIKPGWKNPTVTVHEIGPNGETTYVHGPYVVKSISENHYGEREIEAMDGPNVTLNIKLSTSGFVQQIEKAFNHSMSHAFHHHHVATTPPKVVTTKKDAAAERARAVWEDYFGN